MQINKSLRKLGIVSVSALMLLGVGVGATNASQNVHADSLPAWVQGAMQESKNDVQDAQKQDEQSQLADYKAHPEDAVQAEEGTAEDGTTPSDFRQLEKDTGYHIPAGAKAKYDAQQKAVNDSINESNEQDEKQEKEIDASYNKGNAIHNRAMAKYAKRHTRRIIMKQHRSKCARKHTARKPTHR